MRVVVVGHCERLLLVSEEDGSHLAWRIAAMVAIFPHSVISNA